MVESMLIVVNSEKETAMVITQAVMIHAFELAIKNATDNNTWSADKFKETLHEALLFIGYKSKE